MNHRALYLLGFFLVWSGSAFGETTSIALKSPGVSIDPLRLHLKDCLELALQNNAKLAARDYGIEGAQWRHEESKAQFKPVIEYNNRSAPVPRDAQHAARAFFKGDLTYMNASKFGIGMPVTAFGQLETAQNLAQRGVQAARMEKARDAVKLQFEVKQLYYGVLLSRNLEDLAQDAIRKIEKQLKKEEEEQAHSPYEVLKLKVFKADLERRAAEAQTKGETAKTALRLQMGLNPDQPFDVAAVHLEPRSYDFKSLEAYQNDALVSRPDAELVDVGVEAKRLEYELEKKKRLPKMGVGGFFEIARTTQDIRNVSTTDAFLNPFDYTRAGVGLEIKGSFDFHGSRAKIRRLDSEYRKATLERSLARQGMALEVEESYREALRLKENVGRAEEKEKMARQMMFLSKSNLEVGVGEEQEYTDALQLVLLSRGEYLKAVYDYNVAVAKLDEKVGKRNEKGHE